MVWVCFQSFLSFSIFLPQDNVRFLRVVQLVSCNESLVMHIFKDQVPPPAAGLHIVIGVEVRRRVGQACKDGTLHEGELLRFNADISATLLMPVEWLPKKVVLNTSQESLLFWNIWPLDDEGEASFP